MTLSTESKILFEQCISNEGKTPAVAYMLWFFLGGLGAHRFYLGRTKSAIAMLVVAIVGFLTLPILIGVVILPAVFIWVLVDVILIGGMVREAQEAQRARFSAEADTPALIIETVKEA